MPPKRSINVAKFVSRGDQQGLDDQQDRRRREMLEAAKVPVPKGMSNIRQTRSQSNARSQQGDVKRSSSNPNFATGGQQESKGPFFGTDASSFDHTSTISFKDQDTSDDQHPQQLTEDQATSGHVVGAQAQAGHGQGMIGPDDIDNSNDDQQENQHPLNDEAVPRDDRANIPGTNLGYIKNDSYPDTTSGNPSLADFTNDPARDAAIAQTNAAPRTTYSKMPTRSGGTRLGLSHNRGSPRPGEGRQVHHTEAHIPLSAPSGFQWAPDQVNPMKFSAQHQARFQNPPSQVQADPEAFAKPALPAQPDRARRSLSPRATKHNAPLHDFDDRGQQMASNMAKFRQQGHQHPSPHNQRPVETGGINSQTHHLRQRGRQPAPEDRQEAIRHGFNVYPDHSHNANPTAQPLHLPDHIAQDILGLSYDEIKAQSFDEYPNDEEFEVEGEDQSLAARLSAVMAQENAEDRLCFYRSLGIDEWEEAGDWFLARFADTVGKLRTVRRAKRQLASQFEAEIDDRHRAVSKKKKKIADALDEMRQSGDRVLQATPVKGRSTK